MSRHLYKQYLRLVSKWPKDQNKSSDRDFAVFLAKDVERQFKSATVTPIDSALCERRLQALDQLLNNKVLERHPHNYTSGVFGLRLESLQTASSEESRKQLGLKPKDSIIRKAWRTLFPAKEKTAENT